MIRKGLLIVLLVIQAYPVWAEPMPITVTLTAAERQAHEIVWKSAFKEAMYKNPEQFKRYLYRKDYGQMAAIQEQIRMSIGTIDRYIDTQEIPGPLNARRKFIKELSKDLDAQFGMEAAKVRLQEASNQCTNCMELLAQEAYEFRAKQASGAPLTPDEKAADDVVNGLISSGQLPSIRGRIKEMLRFANSNEITAFAHEETTNAILTALSDYETQSATNQLSLEDYLRKNLKENQLKEMAVDIKWLTTTMKEQAEEAANSRKRAVERAKKEQFFVAANATVNLVGSILRLTNPSEAQRFTNVSSTAISIYKTWSDYQDSGKTMMTKWALTSSTISGALFIVDQMQSQSQSPENQYVMNALDQIREQLKNIESRVGQIDDRLIRLEGGIDALKRDTSAQYASLKEHIDSVSDQLTEGTLREWQKDRSSILDNLRNDLRKCRQLLEVDQLEHGEWLYAKQSASDQKAYRECLSTVLAYTDVYARTFAVTNLPRKSLKDSSDLELFHKSYEANLPPDLWIPQIAMPVALADQTPVRDQPPAQLAPKPNICDELFDVLIWDEAVRAYVELRSRVPDFIINPNIYKNLWEQDQKALALGKKAEKCISQQLSPARFAAVVGQYRQSATDLLTQLHTLTVGFLTEEYQRLWCNQPAVNSFNGLGTPQSWVIRSCFVSGPSYNASPNGHLTISRETIWYPGSTNIPWLGRLTIIPPDLLLLRQDVMALSASLAKHEMPASVTIRMPQSNRLETVLVQHSYPVNPGAPPFKAMETAVVLRLEQRVQSAPDFDALLYGVRGVIALRTVLGQLQAPMLLQPPANLTVPSIQSKHDVKMCLIRSTHDEEGMTKCGSDAVFGCFSVAESTPMSSFSYKRICDGHKYVPFNRDHLTDDNINNLHDQMENWSNESLSTHTTAAMAFRNHGAPRALTSAECGHPKGRCVGSYTYSLTINGLSSEGIFSKDGVFKQAYPLHSVPANIEETFALDQMQAALGQISQGYDGLVDNWLKYLDQKDNLLMPYYQELNRAYIQLKIHAALHLQMSAIPSDGVKAFFQAPLSGNDIQKGIKHHQLPPDFSSRLLLTKGDWRVPFPTVSRMQLITKEMTSKTPCLTTGSSTKYVSFKKGSKAESTRIVSDLYCQMWQEITASEVKRASHQKTIGTGPKGTTIYPFAVGSGYLNHGLAILADQRDMDTIIRTFIAAREGAKKQPVR